MVAAIKHAARIIVFSSNSKEQLCNKLMINYNKVVVSYLAPHSRYQPLDEHQVKEVLAKRYNIRENYILAPADGVTRMNCLRLLEAFSFILKIPELKKYRLFIQGEAGWASDKIAARVKTGNLVGKVAFLEGVTPKERLILMNGASMVVYPPLTEETGVPVMEAMACGAPVACSDIPVHRELFKDAVAYFHPLDSQEMADSISKILMDHDYYRQITASGTQLVRTFNWENTASDHIEAFRQAMSVLEE
ncbi:MAG: glycosyltransferase family 4 protein [Candidatus Eremiobacteraeota bacterium]|nr:glycosyltransferase family 4 protein [Candidatus Eremiobacteraeota bacterium]